MGTKGLVWSSAAIGILLNEGIGDTIRVSLTPRPGGDRREEVYAACEILQALGLRSFSPSVTACPGCGRTTSSTFQELAEAVQGYIRDQMPEWKQRYEGVETLTLAVMGCVVNGPGESKAANIGISLPGTGEAPNCPVFIDGVHATTLRGTYDELARGLPEAARRLRRAQVRQEGGDRVVAHACVPLGRSRWHTWPTIRPDASEAPPCLYCHRVAPAPTSRRARHRLRAPSYDILITNARVLDGSGNPWIAADVAIRGDRIAAVGRLHGASAPTRHRRARAGRSRRDSSTCTRTRQRAWPGALHTAVPLLAQGITTVFINPDGGGPTDLAAQRTALLDAQASASTSRQFVPHGSIRQAVLGMADRAPAPTSCAEMPAITRDGMEAGGLGLSSGLYYAPGSYATTEEVIALARVAAEFGGVYSSHIRDEADYSVGVVASVQEVIRIAEEAHLLGVVSHMKALGPAQWGLSSWR